MSTPNFPSLIDPPPPPPPNGGSFWRGFGIGAAVNFGVSLTVFASVVIGLLQLCWIIPMYVTYSRKQQTETAKGLLLAAGITFLLNAGCWGALLSGSGISFR